MVSFAAVSSSLLPLRLLERAYPPAEPYCSLSLLNQVKTQTLTYLESSGEATRNFHQAVTIFVPYYMRSLVPGNFQYPATQCHVWEYIKPRRSVPGRDTARRSRPVGRFPSGVTLLLVVEEVNAVPGGCLLTSAAFPWPWLAALTAMIEGKGCFVQCNRSTVCSKGLCRMVKQRPVLVKSLLPLIHTYRKSGFEGPVGKLRQSNSVSSGRKGRILKVVRVFFLVEDMVIFSSFRPFKFPPINKCDQVLLEHDCRFSAHGTFRSLSLFELLSVRGKSAGIALATAEYHDDLCSISQDHKPLENHLFSLTLVVNNYTTRKWRCGEN